MQWITWTQAFPSSNDSSAAIQLSERLINSAFTADDLPDYVSGALMEIASSFGLQKVAWFERAPDWTKIAEWGSGESTAQSVMLSESLDRTAAGCGNNSIVVPVGKENAKSVLALTGRGLSDSMLPAAWGAATAFHTGLEVISTRTSSQSQNKRLRVLLDVATQFAGTLESEPLLKLIAEAACQVLQCDRASIFIWDKEHKEVIAKPALGLDGNTLRIPDSTGVVGHVLKTGESVHVDDAENDPRFGKQVDKKTGYETRNLLAEPLNDFDGKRIGVFEAINKLQGSFQPDDQELLSLLSKQAAVAIQNANEHEDLLRSQKNLAEQVTSGVRIIGESAAIVALRTTVERLAETDLPVLILGESGTGKEVVAQSLHYQGSRSSKPFVAVNCAALAESLLESELFGHEKGAFTDAQDTRAGKFELADGGTLFLDEIGDMSLGGQAKLLRVLEQKVITRVGGAQPIPVNVRIVAATNANLPELVRQKKFREDLYYRLSVVTQQLPPLRDRAEDVLVLAEFFLKTFCVQSRRPTLKLSPEAKRRLQSHHWPGNVRELRNLMERVAFLAQGEKVEPDDLAFILAPEPTGGLEPSMDLPLTDATKEFQIEFIKRAVKRVRGNMSDAAKLLGLHRSNLYRKMRQLGMDVEEE
ncbi:sigma-54 interaction domain-containing protein [Calycomorphotria hydatis]|uniref:Nitrogen fixation protein VnfA n=1 Tax=Calycomorphotria hydatis TaxID=2528027 RepID=A0A517T3N9_9PLAN|nr:sigma-54-dependent Fis family transcriptional regulator [Calycomorphotria hydatis]QDT62990.1 Nitrogen fixation protein VnfA [Calycomorphotria hydatis]